MQTFRNLCEKINKKINPGPSLTVLHAPHFSLSLFFFFLPPPRFSLSTPPLPHTLCSLEFFFFDKRNSGGFWQILESGWSSCIFWERLSRASCKKDVAEERCFLADKGKASLRQDVWALAGPCIKEPEWGKGTRCSVSGRKQGPCWLASHSPVFTYPPGENWSTWPSVPWPQRKKSTAMNKNTFLSLKTLLVNKCTQKGALCDSRFKAWSRCFETRPTLWLWLINWPEWQHPSCTSVCSRLLIGAPVFGVISLPFVPAGVPNPAEGPFEPDHILDEGAGRVVPQALESCRGSGQGAATDSLGKDALRCLNNHVHLRRVGHGNCDKVKDGR